MNYRSWREKAMNDLKVADLVLKGSRTLEKARLEKGLELIELISSYAQTTDPKRAWKESYDAIISIYQLVHTLRMPACRKNHQDWIKPIDDALKMDKEKK